ncbi:DegT/DnrJ/EryC1/StrS family aminotransferase [Vibrio breoganii]|uniref:DegT/DnrJ/EryC1/StrS family aminotransferase n=1 Tax=Vibrio breoganii TaxID=553239 RepID=UPI000C822C39|nr:DegT/DnrJ/EryC1/StrS family aminotransferase [Vibrio breoganii]PML40660.1 aminotransferase DegT [Vibrio breoganii]PMO71030.1 aminotransferase DegT [Vibrio breoganii]PMO90472.1 aminotransferase DegT [Vibrio breoganii]
MIALNSPVKPDIRKLTKMLETINNNGWYTNFGPLHKELTIRLEEYLGVKNLLLTNNGTSALQVAARAIGSRHILATPFSFVATVSAFKWQNDEVSFADIDSKSLNLCPTAVKMAYRKGCKADTLVATHVYGNPCDVELFAKLSEENKFQIIYDAAHAFGVKLNGESVLKYGDASTLSFHSTKIFHTVEGGAVIFKNKDDLIKAEEIINFGIRPEIGVVDVGINAKMNEYQAAVGLGNLEVIDQILEHRAGLFELYTKELENVVELPRWHPEANRNGAYMPILLKDNSQMKHLIKHLYERNIQSRNYFTPSLDKLFIDSHNYGAINSRNASEKVLCLPMHAHLATKDVLTITKHIKEIL